MRRTEQQYPTRPPSSTVGVANDPHTTPVGRVIQTASIGAQPCAICERLSGPSGMCPSPSCFAQQRPAQCALQHCMMISLAT